MKALVFRHNLCGSDVKQILLNGSRDNPLTALVSCPHVLGHEVAGRKIDTNERVVLNPWLSLRAPGHRPAVITHRFPRERWDEAVLALKDARRTGVVKVLLEP